MKLTYFLYPNLKQSIHLKPTRNKIMGVLVACSPLFICSFRLAFYAGLPLWSPSCLCSPPSTFFTFVKDLLTVYTGDLTWSDNIKGHQKKLSVTRNTLVSGLKAPILHNALRQNWPSVGVTGCLVSISVSSKVVYTWKLLFFLFRRNEIDFISLSDKDTNFT